MNKLAVAVLVMVAMMSSYADNAYWKGGDGRWNDPKMWRNETVPTADTMVTFDKNKGGRVELNGECFSSQLKISSSGEDFPDSAPVIFCGGGTLQTGAFNLDTGRELTVTNATVKFAPLAAIKIGDERNIGRLEIQDGGVWDATGARNYVYAKSRMFINGGIAK